MSYETQYVIRANKGHAYIRDPTTNRLKELVHAKKIEIKWKMDVDKIIRLGSNIYNHIPGAIEYTGSMELYYCSDYFLKRYIEYAQGIAPPPFFDMQIENGEITDGGNNIGRHHVLLKGVLINSGLGAYLGNDTQLVTDTSECTIENMELIEAFQDYKGFDLGNKHTKGYGRI